MARVSEYLPNRTSSIVLCTSARYTPNKKNPKLVQIAKIVPELKRYLSFFLYGDRAIIYSSDECIVIVWDFMANTLASWFVSVPTTTLFMEENGIINELIKVSETAIVILDCYSVVWIFHIPPLRITKTPLFDIERDVAPILKFKCLEQAALFHCRKPDSWYYGDLRSLPFYLDILYSSQTGLFKLEISSDLGSHSITQITNLSTKDVNLIRSPYRICEDSCVNVAIRHLGFCQDAVTVGSNPRSSGDSSQTPNEYVNWTPLSRFGHIGGFCPASARLVYPVRHHFVLSDFF